MHEAVKQKLIDNLAGADTTDLLDRVTAYRDGMDPDAIPLIEAELRRRGMNERKVEDHRAECERTCLFAADGIALKCSRCRRPAVVVAWGWHRVMGRFPLFPRRLRLCVDHVAKGK